MGDCYLVIMLKGGIEMKWSFLQSNRFCRNIWIFSGLCFIVFTLMHLFAFGNPNVVTTVLTGITAVIAFVNAYIYHGKLKKD